MIELREIWCTLSFADRLRTTGLLVLDKKGNNLYHIRFEDGGRDEIWVTPITDMNSQRHIRNTQEVSRLFSDGKIEVWWIQIGDIHRYGSNLGWKVKEITYREADGLWVHYATNVARDIETAMKGVVGECWAE